MKVLVTGGAGFIGSMLVPLLTRSGHQVSSFDGDVRKVEQLRDFVSHKAFDVVIHLAAISSPVACEKEPSLAYDVNVGGVLSLLEALRSQSRPVHVIFPSTAFVYADPSTMANQQVLSEESLIGPRSVYGRTKWAAEGLFRDEVLRGSNRVTILRLFNHTHKSQSADFFLPHVYQLLHEAVGQDLVEVPVGNVDIYRDISSVQDLLSAFCAVVDKSDAGSLPLEVFNVCSGVAKNLRKTIQKLEARLGAKVRLKVDPSRVRPNEPTWICGSSEKFEKKFEWQSGSRDEESLVNGFLSDLS